MNVKRRSNLVPRLVEVALRWQKRFGVAPAVTSALSELDAALLVGMSEDEYCSDCASRTAVTRGYDFTHRAHRYQVKANRPSGGRARSSRWWAGRTTTSETNWSGSSTTAATPSRRRGNGNEYRRRFETVGCRQPTCGRADASSPSAEQAPPTGTIFRIIGSFCNVAQVPMAGFVRRRASAVRCKRRNPGESKVRWQTRQ